MGERRGWLFGRMRRTRFDYVYPPELLREWARRAMEASGGRDFFFDARFQQEAGGSREVAQSLQGLTGIVFVYPVLEGGQTQGVVFVTDRTLDWTTGYLVVTGPEIPKRHRPGEFLELEPVEQDVYRFESP